MELAEAIVSALHAPTPAELKAWNTAAAQPAFHGMAYAAAACLHQVELCQPPAPGFADRPLRVVAWNVERLFFLEETIAWLQAADADIVLLSEVDCGMGRSGNRHNIAALAGALGLGYAYGVEFIELGLGDPQEAARTGATENRQSLHGNGLLSRYELERPAVARFDDSGLWADGMGGQPRVGGRMAVLAQVRIGGQPVTLASVHLESHTDPTHRAEQMRGLFDLIERYDPKAPVLIGGDLNTNTFARATGERPTDAARLADPVAWEPLFVDATARGYDWRACNLAGATTQRTRPDGMPAPPFGKIDWFLARGLQTSAPAVLPATARDGSAISDHEAIAVTVEALAAR